MTQIGIMIEGQDGLNWMRWKRLLQAAEDFGYQCLFRSDHFTNANPPDKDSLELWVSLTYAASHTQRIEFGPLVTPITFRHPSMLARMAAAISDLSGRRLVLGMGAGWQEREHKKFGVPFYDKTIRLDMLEEGLEVVTRLLKSNLPARYEGKHFSLDDAQILPHPELDGPLILVGGNGPTRTLPLVARFADEWNGVFINPETYRTRNLQLNDYLVEAGRQPGEVKRSLMTQVVFGVDEAAVQKRLNGRDADKLISEGIIVGTASAVVDQIGRFVEAGVERFMLQWLDQDDIDGLEQMARDVLPKSHS
jgi:F420-dependent oxidoreductase-like protein